MRMIDTKGKSRGQLIKEVIEGSEYVGFFRLQSTDTLTVFI